MSAGAEGERPSAEEREGATPLAEELGAADIPATESGEGAARPMVGSFATTGAVQLIQAGTGVLLARILGPEDRGELAAIILWPTLITTIGSLGLAQAVTYHAARTDRLGTLYGSAVVFAAVVAAVLIGFGWAILPLALGGYGSDVVREGQLFLTAYIPLFLLLIASMSLLNGSHRFAWFQGLRLVQMSAIFLGVGALAVSGEMTTATAAGAYVLAYGLAAAIASGVVLRSVLGTLGIAWAQVRALLAFGAKSQLSTSMWNLNERADQLVISVFFSAASLGLYVVAVTLTSLTTLVGFSFALVALPMIARVEALPGRRRLARLIVVATLVCATAVSVPIFAIEPLLIELFFGIDFVDAAGVGRVLLVAGVVFALNRVLEAVLQALGRPLESSVGEGLALAVTAAGLAALLPTIGIMGAGVTSFLAYSASSAFMVRRVARALEMRPLRLLMPDREMLQGARSLIQLVPGLTRR
jgi:O-antigen/teichoic acid export membrane protein